MRSFCYFTKFFFRYKWDRVLLLVTKRLLHEFPHELPNNVSLLGNFGKVSKTTRDYSLVSSIPTKIKTLWNKKILKRRYWTLIATTVGIALFCVKFKLASNFLKLVVVLAYHRRWCINQRKIVLKRNKIKNHLQYWNFISINYVYIIYNCKL